MPRLRASSALCRVLVAAFALWLPAATGQGGKATCNAASTLARSMSGARPHLSCHGENGAKKSCCCTGQDAIRAAACGCHDGQTIFGVAPHDPTLASWSWRAGSRPSSPRAFVTALLDPDGLAAQAPDPPPPKAALQA
ncbi:MAG: hypothetical protein ABR587_07635 [Candidatus Binatia bacterium]